MGGILRESERNNQRRGRIRKVEMEGNILSARWEDTNSWNYNKGEYRPLEPGTTLDIFLQALNKAMPIERSKLEESEGGEIRSDKNTKFLEVILRDKTEVQLILSYLAEKTPNEVRRG